MSVDLLGAEGKARVLADLLASLQEQAYRIALLKDANGAADNEIVPGEKFSYGERLTELDAAQERLLDAADSEVMTEIRRLSNG
jgi:hypothetical protein